MEIVAWLGWAVVAVLGVLWSLVWLLISGWVSTLLQIAVLIATIYFFKYGWQRAPAEILRRTRSFGRFFLELAASTRTSNKHRRSRT